MRNTGGGVAQDPALAEGRPPEQRVLLTLAVRDYDSDYDADAFAEGIDRQIDVVREWWSTPGPAPAFRQVPAPTLKTRDDVEDFLRAQQVRDMRGRALVLFVTGHGIKGKSGTHFLRLPDSVESRPLSTAVRTSDIVSVALDSHVENVLVIINACFAGGVTEEIVALHKDIPLSRRNNCNLSVLVTCSHDSKIQVGKFPHLLEQAYKWLQYKAGITTPYLSVADFVAAYDRGLGDADRQRFKLRYALNEGVSRPTPCLPNPGYVRQDGTSVPDHWLDRATGRPQEQDPGWYFRGRTEQNSRIASFVGQEAPGVLAVTGRSGSGKSALLAHAVLLGDRRFRADPLFKTARDAAAPGTLPPEGAVTAAVHARHLDAAQVATELLHALDAEPGPVPPAADPVEVWTRQLLRLLHDRGRPVTVVLDGLDEARDRERIVGDVLRPLAPLCLPPGPGRRHEDDGSTSRAPAVRLLVSARTARPDASRASAEPGTEAALLRELRGLFPKAPELRTDTERSRPDLTAYVEELIRGFVDDAAAVAERVAGLVWPSFAAARLAGNQLRRADDPSALAGSAEWHDTLRLGVRGLLRRDLALAEEDGLPSDVALALLQAAAFAKGQGVPWGEVWPAIAGVFLARRTLPSDEWDTMIEKLLDGRLGGYLAHSVEDNRRVYWPAHAELGEILLGADAPLLNGGHDV